MFLTISEKDLQEFLPTVRYLDAEDLTLENIKEAIKETAAPYEVPVTFYMDNVRSGGMFSAVETPCLVVQHPAHKEDYYNFCLQIKKQGKVTFVSAASFGTSTQMKKAAYGQNQKGGSGLGTAAFLLGGSAVKAGVIAGSITGGIARGIGKGINAIGKSSAKLEEEQNWYAIMGDILQEVLNV